MSSDIYERSSTDNGKEFIRRLLDISDAHCCPFLQDNPFFVRHLQAPRRSFTNNALCCISDHVRLVQSKRHITLFFATTVKGASLYNQVCTLHSLLGVGVDERTGDEFEASRYSFFELRPQKGEIISED